MLDVSRRKARHSLLLFRLAALVGFVGSGVLLPLALLGIVVGATNLFVSRNSDFLTFIVFVPLHLWFVGSGGGALLGFVGFTMALFTPWRVLQGHRRFKRGTVSALSCGVLSAVAVAGVALCASGLKEWELPVTLLSLALLACALVLCMTADPSIERTFRRPLRARLRATLGRIAGASVPQGAPGTRFLRLHVGPGGILLALGLILLLPVILGGLGSVLPAVVFFPLIFVALFLYAALLVLAARTLWRAVLEFALRSAKPDVQWTAPPRD